MFTWNGINIKTIALEKGIKINDIAKFLNISRQTVNEWINGQVPKGTHVVNLCKLLQINPEELFTEDKKYANLVPLHRKRKSAKVNSAMQEEAKNIINEYIHFFKNQNKSFIVRKLQIYEKTVEQVKSIAQQLRELTNIANSSPFDYENTFLLMKKLGIFIIFRKFPEKIKSYAFYANIEDHRVVFVNTSTNVLDLIFPILHEVVHVISGLNEESEEEELFCDEVASYVQFPEEYVFKVKNLLQATNNDGAKIKLLKEFSSQYKHSLFGIVKRLNKINNNYNNLKIGGADTKLKKQFFTIGEILFSNDDSYNFIKKYENLSPLFIDAIKAQIDKISDGKLAELLGLDSSLDAKQLRKYLKP